MALIILLVLLIGFNFFTGNYFIALMLSEVIAIILLVNFYHYLEEKNINKKTKNKITYTMIALICMSYFYGLSKI